MYLSNKYGRVVLAIFLGLMGVGTSVAGWTPYVENKDGDVTYVDKDTLIRRNGVGRAWFLKEFATPFKGASSGRFYYEADCQEGTMRVLQAIMVSGHNLQGEIIDDTKKPIDIGYVYPKSMNGEYFKYLCGKLPK